MGDRKQQTRSMKNHSMTNYRNVSRPQGASLVGNIDGDKTEQQSPEQAKIQHLCLNHSIDLNTNQEQKSLAMTESNQEPTEGRLHNWK